MKSAYEGFYLTLEMAEEFYKLCAERNAITYEDRLAIMREFVKEKKAKYLRDTEEFLKGKRVIVVKTSKRKSNDR